MHAATAENVDLILHRTYWWPYGESGLYRPLTTLSYLFNYAVLGAADRPASYHAVNLILHVANVLLLWTLIKQATRNDRAAFAAAAIWAVLPLSTEAVTNIVGRADLLAAAGTLGALLSYARARDAGGGRRAAWLAGAAAAAAAATFAKESGFVVLPLIVAFELAFWDPKRSPRALGAGVASLAVPLLAAWSARAAVLGAAPSAAFPFVDNPLVGAGWWTARLTALKTAGMYVWKLVSPMRLSPDYSFDAIPLARGSLDDWLAWLTVAAVLGAMIAAARRSRAAGFLAAFAVIAFLPASNLLFATGTIFGERLLYLPAAGLVALAALALARLPRAAFTCATAVVVVLFAARTWARNPDWTSDLTLWRSAVAAQPSSAKTHHSLAEAMYESDPTHANIDAVIAEQERSVAILDRLPDDRNWFESFRQAGAYHLDKATALKAEGRPEYERALALLERAASIARATAKTREAPNVAQEADVNRLLAAAYVGIHDAPSALSAATRARDLDPLVPLPYRLAATAQLAQQDPDAAAVTLMIGSMVTGDRGLTQALLGLYAAGLDEDGCAATASAEGPALNPGCPVVRRHMCAAAPEAALLDSQLGRFTEAERVTSTARTIAGCRWP